MKVKISYGKYFTKSNLQLQLILKVKHGFIITSMYFQLYLFPLLFPAKCFDAYLERMDLLAPPNDAGVADRGGGG